MAREEAAALKIQDRQADESRKELYRLSVELGEQARIAEEQAAQVEARNAGQHWSRQDAAVTVRPWLLRTIEKLALAASQGPLDRQQVKELKIFSRNFPQAREVLAKCQRITPQEARRRRKEELKSRKERRHAQEAEIVAGHIARIRQAAAQGPLPWRDVEILRVIADPEPAAARDEDEGLLRLNDPRFAAARAEAKELLQKHEANALPRPQTL